MSKFSRILLKFHRESGKKKTDVAKEAGISRPAFYKYLSGERTPPLETIIKLSKVYDVPLQDLVIGEPQERYGRSEDFVSVPLHTAVSGEKPGSNPQLKPAEEEPNYIPVQKNIFRNHNGPFRAFRLQTDSMKPILQSEDVVVVAMGNSALQERPIMYAVHWENQTSVKYVQKQKNKYFLISHDMDVPIVEVELDKDPNPIIGEVIGAWKYFKR